MSEKIIYGPLELPSGKIIKFREATGVDRVNVINMLKMGLDNVGSGSVLVNDYIAAKCITEIDGEPVRQNYRETYENMGDEDFNYYSIVYQEMFGMNDEKRDKAKEAAKNLRSRLTSTAISC